MKENKDFFIGYSPERVNPGDKIHTINNINKNCFYKFQKYIYKKKRYFQFIKWFPKNNLYPRYKERGDSEGNREHSKRSKYSFNE